MGATGVGAMPSDRGTCANVVNGFRSTAPVMRALLVALDGWADGDIEPPRSNYPDVSDGTLATVAEAATTFPTIPGVTFPTVVNELWALDYGPTFGPEGGRITMLPPARCTMQWTTRLAGWSRIHGLSSS